VNTPPSSSTDALAPASHVVAISGSAGFLGRSLVGVLEDDWRVARIVSLDTENPGTGGEKTRHHSFDLAAEGAEKRLEEVFRTERVDTAVHLAFLPYPTHAATYAHELESVGTMRLFNACRRAEVRKVVMHSQSLLYGAHPTNPNFLTERHPLRVRRDEPYFLDKLQAEQEALRFGTPGSGRMVTVLRTAPMLGPTVDNYVTRYLSPRVVLTVLGFDPLFQFVHEADAVAAFKLAVDRDAPGVFNVASDGVLPLSKVIKLVGRTKLPLLGTATRTLSGVLWAARLSLLPPTFANYLKYVCVVDCERAKRSLGFTPMYTSREAVIDYASAQHLRDVKLLSEVPA
jgi:UDP-glucose 4-epimerase